MQWILRVLGHRDSMDILTPGHPKSPMTLIAPALQSDRPYYSYCEDSNSLLRAAKAETKPPHELDNFPRSFILRMDDNRALPVRSLDLPRDPPPRHKTVIPSDSGQTIVE